MLAVHVPDIIQHRELFIITTKEIFLCQSEVVPKHSTKKDICTVFSILLFFCITIPYGITSCTIGIMYTIFD